MESPVWRPRPNTRVTLPGLCVMHGGPVGMHLPEHEHEDVQVEMHFAALRGGKRIAVDENPKFFSLIPSGKPHIGRWENGSEVVVLLLGPTQMEQAAERALCSLREIPATACSLDSVIQAIGLTLRREFLTGGLTDMAYLEAVGAVLSGHLIRRLTADSNRPGYGGRLSPAQLRKIIDFAQAASPGQLRISQLASQLDMGTHRFTRFFRKSTGLTPYQFLLKNRLEQGKALLETTDLSIAELGLELGFGSQSHFTSAFHQHFAITPAAYRRARRSKL